MQTPRLVTLNRVLAELKDVHHDVPQCPGAEHCPTARAIADLEIVIGEMTIEASASPDSDTAHAILRTQGEIGQ